MDGAGEDFQDVQDPPRRAPPSAPGHRSPGQDAHGGSAVSVYSAGTHGGIYPQTGSGIGSRRDWICYLANRAAMHLFLALISV